MRSSIQRTIETMLGLIVLGLLGSLVVPWQQQKLPAKAATQPTSPSPASDALGASPALLPVDVVLTLFTSRTSPAPALASPVAAPAKTPADAPWLKYMGFASSADGALWWYLKDTKTGKVIKVTQGQSAGGWSIVENTADRLVMKNGEDLYAVSKR